MFFLHLLVYKTIQFFIPANSFLFRFNSCNFSLLSALTLIKGAARILFPVLSCGFISYRWFLLRVCALPLFFRHIKFPLFPVLFQRHVFHLRPFQLLFQFPDTFLQRFGVCSFCPFLTQYLNTFPPAITCLVTGSNVARWPVRSAAVTIMFAME